MLRRPFRAVAVFALAACGGSGDGDGGSCDASPPLLSVTAVDFASVTVDQFLPFGFPLSPGQLNPAYELRLRPMNAAVRAATAGVVQAVALNSQGDFEVRVRPTAGSCYQVIYDHVVNVTVAAGATVTAGQVLGQIGPFDTASGRTELQIDLDRPAGTALNTVAVCPVSFGTASFNAAHDTAYAQAGFGAPGVCWQQQVTP